MSGPSYVRVGKITGVFGIRGWVKLWSWTDPPQNLLDYKVFFWRKDEAAPWSPCRLLEGRPHGKGLIARFSACEDRTQAEQWVNYELAIAEEELPDLDEGEYYWHQLVGLRVVNASGRELGVVRRLMATGANDVLCVSGSGGSGKEILIPWRRGDVVRGVDLRGKKIEVNWEVDY